MRCRFMFIAVAVVVASCGRAALDRRAVQGPLVTAPTSVGAADVRVLSAGLNVTVVVSDVVAVSGAAGAVAARASELEGAPSASPSAAVPARRGVATRLGANCDLDVARRLVQRNGAGQYIVVRSNGWSTTKALVDVVTATSESPEPVCQLGSMPAMVGSNGTRPLTERRSGDGTTPAGLFGLATVTAWDGQQFSIFGNAADPGVRVPYRLVQSGDCWGATPGMATYNELYRRPNCPGPDDEYLPAITGAYSHAAVIDANLGPDRSGDQPGEPPYAAAIFLHRHAFDAAGRPKPTRGCVSLSLPDLVATLNLLDPAANPRFAIGPADRLGA